MSDVNDVRFLLMQHPSIIAGVLILLTIYALKPVPSLRHFNRSQGEISFRSLLRST